MKILEKLHPPSLGRGVQKRRRSCRYSHDQRKINFTPEQIVRVLRRLNRGKAAGLFGDTLNLYIKCARRLDLNNPDDYQKAKRLAKLFSLVASRQIPPGFQAVLRKTYLVALEKDPNDKSKLRPLGVPSAIRRIAAAAVLAEYSSVIAEHLLPYNFAVGVSGGCDVIIKTMQLGVDRYITEPEMENRLPTRSLVSLDIVNMFNVVSRNELREIIANVFPTLEGFADMLYEEDGQTYVRMGDGSWAVIGVKEGFSQGCPLSPVFAALVLNSILTKLQPELDARAKARLAAGDKGDDGHGSVGLVMAYVDDVNALLHHDDVHWFLKKFVELATPRGGVLNTMKTRILTSTSGVSLVERMSSSASASIRATGTDLDAAIETYSTTKVNAGEIVKVEVTEGLRVLAAPIGSSTFCRDFLQAAVNKAKLDSEKILNSLDDVQSMVRVYSMCTVHKLTHLFGTDVLNTDRDELPRNYFLWQSDLTDNFSDMTNCFIQSAITSEPLPQHAEIITSMSIKSGGLGLQHPRTCAVTQFMLTMKRCLQYCRDGVWLGFNKPRIPLPLTITCLFRDWDTSNTRVMTAFQQYSQDFVAICAGAPEATEEFIYECSINKCRETMKEHASKMTRSYTLEKSAPDHVAPCLNQMLLEETSLALMTAPRLVPKNRMSNNTFCIVMKRKLRLVVIKDHQHYRCRCGKPVDAWGDHCLGCTANHKTILSNGCRDGIFDVFKRILPLTKLINSGTQMEKETPNIVKSLPRLKPFDLSIRLNHLLTQGAWRTPYSRIGFDVVAIHSTKPAPSDPSGETASFNESDLRLREGERKRFARRTGGTNDVTARTLSADEVIGEINDSNCAFIPIAIGPFRETGSLFKRFFWKEPQAKRAALRAISGTTPYNILGKADARWKSEHGGAFFDGSYLTSLPSTWAKQQLGIVCATQLANHINASFNHLRYDPSGTIDGDGADDGDDSFGPDELDWKWVDVDFLDDGITTHDDTPVPAVNIKARSQNIGCAGSYGGEATSSISTWLECQHPSGRFFFMANANLCADGEGPIARPEQFFYH